MPVNADFYRFDAKVDGLAGEFDGLKASLTRIELLLEEQAAATQLVIEGITALHAGQSRIELRVTQLEETVRRLAAA